MKKSSVYHKQVIKSIQKVSFLLLTKKVKFIVNNSF